MEHRSVTPPNMLTLNVSAKATAEDGSEKPSFSTQEAIILRTITRVDGPGKSMIAGSLVLGAHFESMGEGPEKSLFPSKPAATILLDPCGDGEYPYDLRIEKGTFDVDFCAVPYKVVVTASYKNPCGKCGPVAAWVEISPILLYEE